MLTLTGDIGGTNTRLAVIETDGAEVSVQQIAVFPSARFSGLNDILTRFLASLPHRPDHACFGVAGPVIDQRCDTTNLPWSISAAEIQRAHGFHRAALLNDLEAMAWGLPALRPEQLHTLQTGSGDGVGNRLIIAAGTGLGQAGLFWDGQRHHPFASEGGHADFAPGNELEIALLQFLQQRYDHVSWERVVSGQGLGLIYDFLLHYRQVETPEPLQQAFQTGDKGALISEFAQTGEDALCMEALDLLVRLYAAEAGNHALKLMARGGVYLGGGIPPKILDWLKRPQFIETFRAKGRMAELMLSMPVRVILDDRCGLYGPALYLAATAE